MWNSWWHNLLRTGNWSGALENNVPAHDVLTNQAHCECEFIILTLQKVHLITSICEQWGSMVVICLCPVISKLWVVGATDAGPPALLFYVNIICGEMIIENHSCCSLNKRRLWPPYNTQRSHPGLPKTISVTISPSSAIRNPSLGASGLSPPCMCKIYLESNLKNALHASWPCMSLCSICFGMLDGSCDLRMESLGTWGCSRMCRHWPGAA